MEGVFVELFLIFLSDIAKTGRVSGLRLISVCYNERAVFSSRAIIPWVGLIFTLLLATLAVSRGAGCDVWLCVVVFAVFSIMGLCAIPLQRRRLEREAREKQRFNQLQQERLLRLEECLLAGQLVRLEEWWEDDDLWIDENAHIHFVFSDGEEMDFVLYENLAPEISRLLATQGICWQPSFRLKADSHVIWQRG